MRTYNFSWPWVTSVRAARENNSSVIEFKATRGIGGEEGEEVLVRIEANSLWCLLREWAACENRKLNLARSQHQNEIDVFRRFAREMEDQV